MIIDVRKIPRPERSGVISCLVAYCLMTGFMDIYAANWPEGDFNLWCFMMPLACFGPTPDPADSSRRVKVKQYRIITFYPAGPRGVNGKKPCTCHYDYQLPGRPINHAHNVSELACDNEDLPGQEWTRYRTVKFAGQDGILRVNSEQVPRTSGLAQDEIEWRLHCDDKEKPDEK